MKTCLTFILIVGLSFKIHSQKILIPYREGKLWGLCDTNAVVRVKPQFDDIDLYSINGYYLVHQGGKMGVITKDSTILKPQYMNLSFLDSHLLVVTFSIRVPKTVIDMEGRVKWSGTFDRIIKCNVDFKTPLYTAVNLIKDSIIILAYDSAQKNLYPVIKYKMPRGGGPVRVDRMGTFPIIYLEDSIKRIYYNEASRRVEVLSYMKESRQRKHALDSGYTGIVTLEYNYKLGHVERHWRSFKNGHENESVEMVELLSLLPDARHFHGYGYSERISNCYTINIGDTLIKFRSYLVYQKGNKYGLVADHTIIPAEYDTIGQPICVKEQGPFFMLGIKENGKFQWGVVDRAGRKMVPTEFDSIHLWMMHYGDEAYIRAPQCYSNPARYVQGFVAFKGDCQTIFDNEGKQLLEAKCATVKTHGVSLQIVEGEKYGFFKDTKLYCQPIFPYPVYNHSVFEGYWLLTIKDASGKFLGYANKNGVLYFKN